MEQLHPQHPDTPIGAPDKTGKRVAWWAMCAVAVLWAGFDVAMAIVAHAWWIRVAALGSIAFMAGYTPRLWKNRPWRSA